MKKRIAVFCALLIPVAGIVFAQQTAQHQKTQYQTTSLTTQQKNIQEYVELLRSDIRQQKAEIMGAMMGLDIEQEIGRAHV